jgi:hypothetical protein
VPRTATGRELLIAPQGWKDVRPVRSKSAVSPESPSQGELPMPDAPPDAPPPPSRPPAPPPLRPPPEEVAERAKHTFGVAYLTLTGVTQSVALAVLVARVEETHGDFGAANWLMAVTAFLLIVVIWNEYSILSVAYLWTPTVMDALLPFSLLALQGFLVHNVYPDQQAWLFSLAAVFGVGAIAFVYGFAQAGRHHAENRDVLNAIGFHRHMTMISAGIAGALCLGAGLLYDEAGLADVPEVVAVGSLLLALITIVRSIPYARRVNAYAALARARPAATEHDGRQAAGVTDGQRA